MKFRQASLDGCEIPNFTRRQLPDKSLDPELHDTLRDMCIHKKALEEDIDDAVQEGNDDVHQQLMEQHASINRAMFTMLHPNLTVQDDRSWKSEQREPGSQDKSIDKPDVPSVAPGDDDQFVIYFEYEEDEVPTVVWQHMPVALLLRAAVEMLLERGTFFHPDRVVLRHEDRIIDPLVHRLSDHNIISEDVFKILVIEEPPSVVYSGNGGPKGQQHPDGAASSIHSRRLSFTKESSLNVKRKYYAVRRGRNIGIYETWAACERQVKGFPGAEHQSFRTKQEAYQFLAASGRERPKDRSEQRNHDPVGGFEASKSQDKIKQTFKCPKFSGNAKDWKLWNKGFQRYLSIWDIDYVLLPNFYDERPLSAKKINDNKLVYFILEDATQSSPLASSLASSYVRQAPMKKGFEAFYTLHDGFVFAGSTAFHNTLEFLS